MRPVIFVGFLLNLWFRFILKLRVEGRGATSSPSSICSIITPCEGGGGFIEGSSIVATLSFSISIISYLFNQRHRSSILHIYVLESTLRPRCRCWRGGGRRVSAMAGVAQDEEDERKRLFFPAQHLPPPPSSSSPEWNCAVAVVVLLSSTLIK